MNRGPSIVVATPGRLWDLVQEGQSHLAALNTISYLAIDETDRMSEKGHFEELEKILEVIRTGEEAESRRRQTFVMSATLSLVHRPPAHVKGKKAKWYIRNQVGDKFQHKSPVPTPYTPCSINIMAF